VQEGHGVGKARAKLRKEPEGRHVRGSRRVGSTSGRRWSTEYRHGRMREIA
jgi:hypothetical protein